MWLQVVVNRDHCNARRKTHDTHQDKKEWMVDVSAATTTRKWRPMTLAKYQNVIIYGMNRNEETSR